MSKAFWLRFRLQLLALESSILSKLISGCKLLVAKNGNNFVDADSLLLAENLTIASFFG